jgi:esterase/lipase superfamily enzyme
LNYLNISDHEAIQVSQMRWMGAAILALNLAGCSTFPVADRTHCNLPLANNLQPVITVYYATNRMLVENDGILSFSHGRSDNLRFGKAIVVLPADGARSVGSISGIRIERVTATTDRTNFTELLKSAQQSGRRRDTLVYVHGYNNSFERSIIRAAQFVHDGCLDVVPVVFSWPSYGSPLERNYDEDSATFSRKAASEILAQVRDESGSARTHILAHSMGNWITIEALDAIGNSVNSRGAFGAVILASPDVDADVFRQKIWRLRTSARTVALLASQNDLILRLSQFLASGMPRVGAASTEELFAHGITGKGNFVIVRMDAPQVGICPELGHECATGNYLVLERIAMLLRRHGDLEPQSPSHIGTITPVRVSGEH